MVICYTAVENQQITVIGYQGSFALKFQETSLSKRDKKKNCLYFDPLKFHFIISVLWDRI